VTTDFWAALTDLEREAFEGRSVVRRWRRGEVLFHQGDDSDWVTVIQSGRIKASSYTSGGAEVVLAVRIVVLREFIEGLHAVKYLL